MDNALFHKLIRKQRGKCQKFIDELNVDGENFKDHNILNGFKKHFQSLANQSDYSKYDTSYLEQVNEEIPIIYQNCTEQCQKGEQITYKEIKSAIHSLNRGKAPDACGVTAEHLYYGSEQLIEVTLDIMNTILLSRNVQNILKIGILNPIFKNKGSINDSVNYRGITITPTLTRLLEAVLKK